MVTFRYEVGDGRQTEIEPVDNEFEYLESIDMWSVKVGQTASDDEVILIPKDRIYEIEGRQSRIRPTRP